MKKNSPTERFPARRPHGARFAGALVAALLLGPLSTTSQQAAKPSEYDVKATYLLNFGRFVRSTAAKVSRSSFDICILGRDQMGQALDALAANDTINGIPIHIRRLGDATAAKGCSIVFVSALEGDHLREDMALLAGSDALTVSDASDFLDRGGMIQFVLIENRLRFAVNLNAVNRAHLVLSSELLRVASSVSGNPPSEDQP